MELRPLPRRDVSPGWVALAAVVIGFFRTFLLPSWQGSFRGPTIAYVHGSFVLAWILLYLTQAWWIQSRRFPVIARWEHSQASSLRA